MSDVEAFIAEQLQIPEIRKEYEALKPKYDAIRERITQEPKAASKEAANLLEE